MKLCKGTMVKFYLGANNPDNNRIVPITQPSSCVVAQVFNDKQL